MPQRTPNKPNVLSFRRAKGDGRDEIFEVFEEHKEERKEEHKEEQGPPPLEPSALISKSEALIIAIDLMKNPGGGAFKKLRESVFFPSEERIKKNSYFRNELGENIIHVASKNGEHEALNNILEGLKHEYLQSLNLNSGHGRKDIPLNLYTAFDTNSEEIIKKLILENKNIKNSRNKFGETPLHLACEKGFEKSVELLLKKNCDVNAIDSLLETPLHKAVQNDHIATTEMLLNNPEIRIDAQNSSKETALHIACENNFKNLAKLLIFKRADLNIKNEKNLTPLHIAVKNGHYDIAKLLLENGAEVDCRGQFEQTSLHVAVKNGYYDIAQLLLENGADINAKNQLGFTALHNAVKSSDVTVDMVKLLLENKADINIKDSSNKTAFDISEEKLRSSSSNYVLMEIKSMLEERQKFEASSTLKALLAEASSSSKEPIILRPLSYYKFTKDGQDKGLGVD